MTHQERLIACGLLRVRSKEEEVRRNGLLARIAEGEKIPFDDRPIYCVFRSDDWRTHISLSGDRCCKSAELIADKLFSYEAHVLCTRLNNHDEELPLLHPKSPYRQSLYKTCGHEEWEEWKVQRAQISMFETEVPQ